MYIRDLDLFVFGGLVMFKISKKICLILLSLALLFTITFFNMPKALTENEILAKIDKIFFEWSENVLDIEKA